MKSEPSGCLVLKILTGVADFVEVAREPRRVKEGLRHLYVVRDERFLDESVIAVVNN